jgi:hypothetical protein
MSEIIDVMTLPLAQTPNVTIDTTGPDYVAATFPVGNGRLINFAGKQIFQAGDSFKLLALGIILPEATTLFKGPLWLPLPYMSLQAEGAVSTEIYSNPNFSSGQLFLPSENMEFVLNTFYDCKDSFQMAFPTIYLTSERFYLIGAIGNINVSMLGIPVSLNTKLLQIGMFYKILHTLPLV